MSHFSREIVRTAISWCLVMRGVHKGGFEYKVKPPKSSHHRHAAEHAEMVSAYGMLKDEIITEVRICQLLFHLEGMPLTLLLLVKHFRY